MKKQTTLSIALGVLLGASLLTAQQSGTIGNSPWHVDAGLVYGFEIEEPGIQVGGGYSIAEVPGLRVAGDFTYYFTDDGAFGAGNVDTTFYTIAVYAQYVFAEVEQFRFYGQGGLNYSRFSADFSHPVFGRSSVSDSDIGLQLGVGTEFALTLEHHLYAELVYNTGDYDQAVLGFGYRFHF